MLTRVYEFLVANTYSYLVMQGDDSLSLFFYKVYLVGNVSQLVKGDNRKRYEIFKAFVYFIIKVTSHCFK